MTPDLSLEPLDASTPTIPSTAGMTTKVVKGSLWTLAGQVLPMAVSFVATPFTIRLLGSEAYGVVILVGLIPTYFAFADFGMGIASTKFGSEAYGEGNLEKEGEIVRTAAFIAFVASLVIAIPLFFFSSWIISQFAVPENLQHIASVALKITSVSFVLGIMASVLNTPMLARLRMDLNAITNVVPKVLIAVLTPIILYLGGGILGAVWMGFAAGLIGLVFLMYFSSKLLPGLTRLTINRNYFRPLNKFGGALVIGGVAGLLLVNFEKLVLTKFVSVKALAYYSVAFTLANMTMMFASAMTQSLIPAFSQLQGADKKEQLEALFSRGIRLSLVGMLPVLVVIFVLARPFFTIWAGAEFGEESTLPFYFLLLGLLFNIFAVIPHTIITAIGRTDIIAKLYWIELAIYAVCSVLLVQRFQIVGAAIAWSIRVILDALIFVWLSNKVGKLSFNFRHYIGRLALGSAFLLLPLAFVILYSNFSFWLLLILPLCCFLYFAVAWRRILDVDEKKFILDRVASIVRMLGLKYS